MHVSSRAIVRSNAWRILLLRLAEAGKLAGDVLDATRPASRLHDRVAVGLVHRSEARCRVAGAGEFSAEGCDVRLAMPVRGEL